jgi:nucleoside-diphosphate-sugar epimerase
LKKRVLVTGADGFIGSHLVEALVAEGFIVRVFVFYNFFNSWVAAGTVTIKIGKRFMMQIASCGRLPARHKPDR